MAVPLCSSSLNDYDDIKEEDGKQVGDNLSLLYKETRDEKEYSVLLNFYFCAYKWNINNDTDWIYLGINYSYHEAECGIYYYDFYFE